MWRPLGRSRVNHSLSWNDVPCMHRKVSVFLTPALAILVNVLGRYPLLSTGKGSIIHLVPLYQKEMHLAGWIKNGSWLMQEHRGHEEADSISKQDGACVGLP